MELIQITLSIYALAIGVAFFIALVLVLMGKLIKLAGFKDEAPAAIPGTPAGQIMPNAGADYAAIAVAIAAAKRESDK